MADIFSQIGSGLNQVGSGINSFLNPTNGGGGGGGGGGGASAPQMTGYTNPSSFNPASYQTGGSNQITSYPTNPTTSNNSGNPITVAQQAPPQNPNAIQQVSPFFDQANSILNGAYDSTSQLGQGIQNNLNAFQDAQTGQINNDATQSQNTVTNQRSSENQAAQNAMSQSRRGANELLQGIQSRYGGSTGTGAFASEIVGGQTQQALGQLQQGLGSNLAKLDQASQQIQQLAQQHLLDLKSSVQSTLATAQSQLQQQLNQIRLAQADTQTHKADLAYQAIQTYQQQIQQVNSQNAAVQNQIQAQELYMQNMIGGQKQQYIQAIPAAGQYSAPNLGSNFFGGGVQAQPTSFNAINYSGQPQQSGNQNGLYNPVQQ